MGRCILDDLLRIIDRAIPQSLCTYLPFTNLPCIKTRRILCDRIWSRGVTYIYRSFLYNLYAFQRKVEPLVRVQSWLRHLKLSSTKEYSTKESSTKESSTKENSTKENLATENQKRRFLKTKLCIQWIIACLWTRQKRLSRKLR